MQCTVYAHRMAIECAGIVMAEGTTTLYLHLRSEKAGSARCTTPQQHPPGCLREHVDVAAGIQDKVRRHS